MSKRRFEQSMNPREHIQSELKDAGISHPNEWREAFVLDIENLTYLEGDEIIYDREKIKQFSETTDSIERLELLHSMSLRDAIECLKNYSTTNKPYKYIVNRLDFYQKLIQGKATKRQIESEWNEKKDEYIQVEKEYFIDASDVTLETIYLGLLRDVEFAAMIGTPELGIFKIVDKRLKAKDISRTHMPKLKGYHSGIHEGSVGYAYSFLHTLYERAWKNVEKQMHDQKVDPQVTEHRAVILAANWLEEAMNYNNPNRGPESPYVGSLDEAIAWARLGSQVKKQLLGMRRKLQGIDLHNIERFIGKSGDNRYSFEKKRIENDIKALEDFIQDNQDWDAFFWEMKNENGTEEQIKGRLAAELMTKQKNIEAIQRANHWFDREKEKIDRWFEKSKIKIAGYNDVTEETRRSIFESVQARYNEKLFNLQQEYEQEIVRLESRTPEDLLQVLKDRRDIVNKRFEKRKSLAQKALDLHFALNHEGENYDSKPLGRLVDWINYAPLGTIKKSHRLLKQGASEDLIITHALVDIIIGKRQATPEDMGIVQALVQKAKKQDYYSQQKLQGMLKVGNILSTAGYDVGLQEIAEIAGKNFRGMTEALKMYDLGQVKQFINQGINLQSIVTSKKVTEKNGYNLSPVEIAEIASHNIDGLGDAFRSFDLDAIRFLLKQDVDLPVAIAVLNNTRQFGYELEINQIANIVKNVRNIEDFTQALRNLPLEKVERIFSDGIAYNEYIQVKDALYKHRLNSDFNAVHLLAKKLTRTREYYNLDSILDTFSLDEVKQILDQGGTLGDVLEVGNALKEKEVSTNLQEIILFEKYSGDYIKGHYVSQAIDAFGIDNVRKIVGKSCRLDKAIEVNNYINGDSSRSRYRSSDNEISESLRESLKKGGIDVVIAIAKAGNMEVAVKTIEAGFTIEEIIKFPFLISPLVMKK